MQAYITAQVESFRNKGCNVDNMILKVTETPFPPSVLPNFQLIGSSLAYFLIFS